MVSQISNPTLQAVLSELKQSIFQQLLVADIGKIKTFDSETQTATIELVITNAIQTYEGVAIIKPPLLVNVPVKIPYGQKGGVYFSIVEGDYVLIVYNNNSIDNWFSGTDNQPPNVTRQHHQHDAIAIPFIHNKNTVIKDYDNDSVTMQYQDTNSQPISIVKLNATEAVIKSGSATITINGGNINIDGGTINITGSEVNIGSKVNLGGASAEVLNKNAVMQVAVPVGAGGTYPVTIINAGQTDTKA